MFIEQMIEILAATDWIFTSSDRKFVRSIARRVDENKPLTTRQGWAIIKTIRNANVHPHLGLKREELTELLNKPKWRKPLVPSLEIRDEVRYLGDNKLGFRGSGSRHEVAFAALKSVFMNGMKVVCVENPAMLDGVVELIGNYGFAMDAATEKWLADAYSARGLKSQVVVHQDKMIFDLPSDFVLGQFVHHVLRADLL